MGQGVDVAESTHVQRVTCAGCGSVLDCLIEYPEGYTPPPGWDWITPPAKHALYCPVCGTDLGIEGYAVAVYEKLTKTTVICPNCRTHLDLTVSSITEHNVEQYCPVCGTAAC